MRCVPLAATPPRVAGAISGARRRQPWLCIGTSRCCVGVLRACSCTCWLEVGVSSSRLPVAKKCMQEEGATSAARKNKTNNRWLFRSCTAANACMRVQLQMHACVFVARLHNWLVPAAYTSSCNCCKCIFGACLYNWLVPAAYTFL
jgi:hypothetical protein